MKFYLLLFFLSFLDFGFCQNNFDVSFTPTRAQGLAPEILRNDLTEKINRNISSDILINEEGRAKYASFSTFVMARVIESSDVLFGDPMSAYVEKVGQRLIKNDETLKNEIHFFVLKKNYTNALCTESGIIFVTTGLLSQIENEAQLAFILAHEISHYKEKHLQKAFAKSERSVLNTSISYEEISLLSRNHESEADQNAVKIYHDAGYTKDEISKVFTVLMYSYLPFNELPIDNNFINDTNIYIPQSYFPEKSNPILAFESYDDSKSSHPNIKNRKTSIGETVNKFTNWKDSVHYFPVEDFENVRTTAKFETLNNDILYGDYIKAMYEIFLLEKQFPNNEFLQLAEAVTWSSINFVYASGGKRSLLLNSSKIEGSISSLYGFFNKISPEELALLSVRVIEDIYIAHPEMESIKQIREDNVKPLPYYNSIDINSLEKISFKEALKLNKKESNSIDTASIQNASKYERIQNIKIQNSSSATVRPLIDENFSYFLLNDISDKEEFVQLYKKAQESKNTKKEVVKPEKDKNDEVVAHDILYLNAYLVSKTEEDFDYEGTKLYYDLLAEQIDKYAIKVPNFQNKISVFTPSFTSEKYVENCELSDYIFHLSSHLNSRFHYFFISQEKVNTVISKYQNPVLLLVYGKYSVSSYKKSYFYAMANYFDLEKREELPNTTFSTSSKLTKSPVATFVSLVFKNLLN